MNTVSQVTGSFCQLSVSRRHGSIIKALPHYVHEKFRGWVAKSPAPHPMVITRVSLCEDGYQELSLPLPRVRNKPARTPAMADTGAQLVVSGMNLVHALGITRKELIPLATRVNAAGDNGLGLIGGDADHNHSSG